MTRSKVEAVEGRLALVSVPAISSLFTAGPNVRDVQALKGIRHVQFDCAMTTSVAGSGADLLAAAAIAPSPATPSRTILITWRLHGTGLTHLVAFPRLLLTCSPGRVMANSSDPARRRWSDLAVLGLVRAGTASLRQSFAVLLAPLGDNAQAAFARLFDNGYHPNASEEHTRRLEGISVRNLSVRYGDRYAFESLTGNFAPASLTAVVGPNGAGKSSLLKALAGILRPAAGEVTCAAVERHRLAYLPQRDELDRGFPITVAELVALGDWRNFGALRKPPRRLAASVYEAIAAVGLSSLADQQISELSVGQFQRALFARLLLQDTDVILLDEPFASLDENTTQDLLPILQRWRTEGRTVVAVLHDLDQVRRYFPSTLLLARSPIAWGETSVSLSVDNLARAKQALNPPESAHIGLVA